MHGFFDRHDAREGLMYGDVAVITDGVQGIKDFFEIHSATVPYADVIYWNASSAPGVDGTFGLRVESAVLHVDVENVLLDRFYPMFSILLTSCEPVCRFIDNPEILSIYCF